MWRPLVQVAALFALLQVAVTSVDGAWRPGARPGTETIVRRVAVFGKDERSAVPERLAPLKGQIGLLFNNKARTVCTAFCIAPDLIATAAHCIFRAHESLAPVLSDYWFTTEISAEAAYSRIAGSQSGSAEQSVMAGATRLRVKPPIDASSDWAAIRLADPVCRSGVLAITALSSNELHKAAAEQRIYQVAYHRDYKEWELAYSPACEVRDEFSGLSRTTVDKDFAHAEGLILHKCDTGEASSGSPLLLEAPGGPFVIGINVGTYVQSKVLLQDGQVTQRSKPRTLANTGISATAFAGPIETFRRSVVATASSDIAEFQTRLRRLDLYAGPPDGTFGELTRAAIQAYERSLGLPETGMPTADLARRLLNAPPLPERKPIGLTGTLLAPPVRPE